ncbi:MAG: ATP-binding protein [Bacillota bacterium]|nr:ATP-binding protein [Bacillota bacterium]
MKEGKAKRKLWYGSLGTAVIVAALLCTLPLVFMLREYQQKTDDTITRLSEEYLSELAEQTAAHLETSLQSQFAQIIMMASAAGDDDLADLESLQSFLLRQKEINDFTYVALLDANGICYTGDDYYSAVSKINSLGTLLDGQGVLISANETLLGDNTILLGASIDGIVFDGTPIAAVLVGMDTNTLSQRLVLHKEGSNAYADVISGQGAFIMRSAMGKERGGVNYFGVLEARAVLDEGYSLEAMRRDVAERREGMVGFTMAGGHEYVYYAPISNTQWTICVTMLSGGMDVSVAELSSFMSRNTVLMVALITIAILSFFMIYIRGANRSARLLEKEKERAEEALAHAERASLAKSEFLSRMSHEIRTPMNGIIGMAAIAMQNLEDPARVRDCLKKVSISSRHLLALINDVLDMSKIESGKIEIRNESFDLLALMESLAVVYDTQAGGRGIQFSTMACGDVREELKGDSLRLNQILTNLLSNAIKFTPEGGRVTLQVRELKQEEERIWLRFQVTDTGCGIAKENQEKIFHAFEQENAHITEKYGGTGLGLSISQRLVQLMGGTLSVESEEGEGSTFTADIPFGVLSQAPEAAHIISHDTVIKPERAAEYDFRDKQVLIVEDNTINREIAVELIGRSGAVISTAVNGKEAVEMFSASPPGYFDLLLMDVQMPVMDGYEATAAIRAMERPDAKTVPIFATTANAFSEDVEKSRKCGMNAHINKPLDMEELYRRMDEAFRKR